MKNKYFILIFFLFLIVFIFLNFKTYEYKVENFTQKKKIETTYFKKGLNFLIRYFDTKNFIKSVFKGIHELDDFKKNEVIFLWIKNNIELNNEDVIDDHHVNIIKRKKGTNDQRALIFALISNFIKMNSFYKCSEKYDVCLTFIQHMDGRWFYFDINNWTINDLKNLNEKNLFNSNNINNHSFKKRLEYNEIFITLDDDLNNELYKNTSYIQTPIKRLIYFINEKK